MADKPQDEKTEALPWVPDNQWQVPVRNPSLLSIASFGGLFSAPFGSSIFPPIPPDFQEPTEDHPIYSWIGRIAAKWSRFEHDLDKLIWELSGVPDGIGACITGPLMGYSSKLLAIVALAKHLNIDDGLIKRTMKLYQDAETQAEERNRCVHDAWFEEPQSKTLHQHKSVTRKDVKRGAKEKLTFGIQSKQEKQLKTTVAAISELIERLSKLHAEISLERHTSPGKP